MFFTKLWFFLIALVGAVAVARVLAEPRVMQRELDTQTEARLGMADHAARRLLELHARRWLDAVSEATTDAVIVDALDFAARETRDPHLLQPTVQERLRQFLATWKAGFVLAVDVRGRLVARAGGEDAGFGEDLTVYPLVLEALRGWRLDETWLLDGKAYRVCAAPVIAAGQRYAGAMLVGVELGAELAEAMRESLGVEVAFLVGGRPSGKVTGPLELPDFERHARAELRRLGQGDHSTVLPLAGAGHRYSAVLLPLAGEAGERQAACALWLEHARVGSPLAGLQSLARVPLEQHELSLVGGGLAAALVLFLLLAAVERGGPARRLVRELRRARRSSPPYVDEKRYRGPFRALAQAINQFGGKSEDELEDALEAAPTLPQGKRAAASSPAPPALLGSTAPTAARVAPPERAAEGIALMEETLLPAPVPAWTDSLDDTAEAPETTTAPGRPALAPDPDEVDTLVGAGRSAAAASAEPFRPPPSVPARG